MAELNKILWILASILSAAVFIGGIAAIFISYSMALALMNNVTGRIILKIISVFITAVTGIILIFAGFFGLSRSVSNL